MAEVKDGLGRRIESGQERGDRIKEAAREKLNERNESKNALDSVNAVDSDTRDAVELSRREAERTSAEIADNVIRNPGQEVRGALRETALESKDYAARESENAENARGMTGDYGSIGGSLSGKLMESSREFQSIADRGESLEQSFQQEFDSAEAAQRAPW